jgi:hypothetical protein
MSRNFSPRAALFCALRLALFLVVAETAAAQEDGSYQVPQTVFVGDPGQLVVPLKVPAAGVTPAVLSPADLPPVEDLVISRIELENRGESPRLLITFKAYAPGRYRLPPVAIGSFTFSDLEITIASILEVGEYPRVLAESAPPLAAPGTMVMIYGAVLGLILAVLALAALNFWGIPGFKRYREIWRRRRAFRSMVNLLKQLRVQLDKDGSAGAAVLDSFTGEFRIFLELVTGINCRTVTSDEFFRLPPLPLPEGAAVPGTGVEAAPGSRNIGPFLSDLFRRCDALRFGGWNAEPSDIHAILDQARAFIADLEEANVSPAADTSPAKHTSGRKPGDSPAIGGAV